MIIAIPSLRERPEDIAPLIERVLTRLRMQLGRPLTIAPEAQRALLAYPWPGNVRELQSILERLALTVESSEIGLEHLPQTIRQPRATLNPRADAGESHDVISLAEAERRAIAQALQATGSNTSQAARLLGIGRSTLWRKMKTYGLTI